MTFSDPKSRAQIAQYIKHKAPACEDWNAINRSRWTNYLRSAWEISQLRTDAARGETETSGL